MAIEDELKTEKIIAKTRQSLITGMILCKVFFAALCDMPPGPLDISVLSRSFALLTSFSLFIHAPAQSLCTGPYIFSLAFSEGICVCVSHSNYDYRCVFLQIGWAKLRYLVRNFCHKMRK